MTATLTTPADVSTPEAGPSDRLWWITLAVIALAGLVIRVAWVVSTRHLTLGGDAYFYHYQANLLASGHGFVEPAFYQHGQVVASAYHPPLWTVYLASFSTIGVRSWLGHRLAGCLLGLVTVGAVGLLARRAGGRRAGLVAAGLAALYPLVWVNDGVGMSEALVLPLCALALLLALHLVDRPSVGRAAALGVVCGLAALARSEQSLLFVFLAVPAALVAARAQSWRPRLALVGACALAAGLTVAPWIGRNLVTFRQPVTLSTNLGPTLAVSNCAPTFDRKGQFFAFWYLGCVQGPQPAGDESQQDTAWRHRALQFISHHTGELPIVVLAREGRLWNLFRPLEGTHLDGLEGRPLTLTRAGLVIFYLLLPLAIAGGWVLHRRHARVWPFLVPPLIVSLTVALTFADTRYRAPAEVSLVVLAAVAIEALFPSPGRARG